MTFSDRAQSISVRLITLFSLLFMAWFIYSQRDGLGRFVTYLADALRHIPHSVRNVFQYYSELPYSVWVPSVIFGAAAGVLAVTAIHALSDNDQIRNIQIPLWKYVATGVSLLILVLIGINGILAIVIALFVLIATIILQSNFSDLIRSFEAANITRNWRWLLIVMSSGLVGGIIGSQLLMYPLQHCTYTSDATTFEKQSGYVLTLIGVVIVLLPLSAGISQRQRPTNLSTAGYFRGLVIPVLFLLPTLLILAVFLYFPASEILSTSLVQSNARIPGREVFVCLQNYTRLAEDVTYRNSFVVTGIVTIAIVMAALAISLGIAVLASQKVRGAYIYRTLLIWPYALSPVVAGVIFFTMFQPDSGLINYVLEALFGIRLHWFTEIALAQFMIVLASVWNILGFNILFYIAGLQTIPRDLLEAAEIDGAGRLTRFWRITVPLLSPFTFFLLITNITYSFYGIYGVVDTLTQGGPRFGPGGSSGATEVLIYRLYQGSAQAGFAAAQAVILFVLIAGLTILQFGYIERRVTYAE